MIEKSYCYMVICSDGTFYTGWTLDLDRRMEEHNAPNSPTKYTRTRQPVKLLYYEEFDTRAKAAQREDQIKRMTRQQKLALLASKGITI